MIDIKFGVGSRGKKAVVERLTSEVDEKWKDEKKHSRNQVRKPRGRTEGRRQTETSRCRNKRKM